MKSVNAKQAKDLYHTRTSKQKYIKPAQLYGLTESIKHTILHQTT
jgi:hypothetical protein